MTEYPSPCDKCPDGDSCVRGNGCEAWRIRYLYRQKQINAHARARTTKSLATKKAFAYEHPDLVRRYIAHGPCEKCKAAKVCDKPCPAYLRWWDARMEIARKKANL